MPNANMQKPVSIKLIKAVLTNPHLLELFDGTETHSPTLQFVNSLLPLTQEEDLIQNLVESALPVKYDGDTLKEVPEMVRSGIKKGIHLGSAQDAKSSPKISEICLQLIYLEEPVFYHDLKRVAYIAVPAGDGGSFSYRISSADGKNWIRHLLYTNTGKAIADQSLNEVIAILKAKAVFEGAQEKINLRIGGLKERVYIDLGRSDAKVVEITANGWSIENESPIKFFRSAGFDKLPLPERFGEFQQLRKLLGLSSKNWVLILAFILNAFNPKGPYFWLLISAEQGAGKSLLCQIIKRIIDPMVANVLRLPKTEQDLMVQAEGNALLVYDNVSGIKWDMSDALCALSTGTGFVTRKLYSNADVQIFSLKRPYIINGIGEFASRPDLLDRAIPLHLPSMDSEKKKTEKELFAEFKEMLPGLLGCLYGIVAHALKFHDKVGTPTGIRMADAAQWLVAAEGACGLPEGTFVETIKGVQHDLFVDTVINDPVAITLRDLIDTLGGPYEGTVGNLFSALFDKALQRGQFPKTPSHLSKAITRLKPSLIKAGIHVEFQGRTRQGQMIKIWIDPPDDESEGPGF